MKALALSMALAAAMTQTAAPKPTAAAPRPPTRNVGSMSDLMVKIIYPTSDAIFYIESRTPKDEAEWNAFEGQALMLAESANLLMMPGRARDQKQWMADAKLMLDAGVAAVKAAKTKNVEAVSAVSDQLLESCTTCHKHYRPGYGQKPQPRLN
jgi:cytochrome c556